MKCLIQDLKSGALELLDVPRPQNCENHCLVETRRTLISKGTERSLRDFGKSNYFQKIKSNPERVQQALQKIGADGVIATYQAINARLNDGLPLGYCNVGTVSETSCSELKRGVRVASNGPHAEVVRVPANLCAQIPDNVSDDQAAFTVVGAIGLQAIRLLNPSVGENICVIGAGLVGQMCIQLLVASGCRVLATDLDQTKLEIASCFGAEIINGSERENVLYGASEFSNGRGVDGVVIAASSESDRIISDAAEICRKRASIVLVGAVGLNLQRRDFYEKELRFQVSASYGPGRYDINYEARGRDYPYAFVRWTAQRNFEAVLGLIASGQLQVDPLISRSYAFEQAFKAYEEIEKHEVMGVLLEFDGVREDKNPYSVRVTSFAKPAQSLTTKKVEGPRAGVFGSGNYTTRVLLPELKKSGVELQTLVAGDGARGLRLGRRFGFSEVSTTGDTVWTNHQIDTVISAGRHCDHGKQVIQGLAHGKNIFVEKPLALTCQELDDIEVAFADASSNEASPLLMVDFNRRFSPLVCRAKDLLKDVHGPKAVIYTVNAGKVEDSHWIHDPIVGGGRIKGEVCHFIDLVRFLAGAEIVDRRISGMSRLAGNSIESDALSIFFKFADGSVATIHYLTNGGRRYPKEKIEIFCAGRTLLLDNFRSLTGFNWPGFKRTRLWRQNKGNHESLRAFISAMKTGGVPPIPPDDLFEVTRETLLVADLARSC